MSLLPLLEVLSHHSQRLGHAAARLGDFDHAEEHRAERLRLSRHRFLERRSTLNRDLHAPQDRPQCGPLELLFQARERTKEIDARAQIRSKLPAELGELAGAHPAEQISARTRLGRPPEPHTHRRDLPYERARPDFDVVALARLGLTGSGDPTRLGRKVE